MTAGFGSQSLRLRRDHAHRGQQTPERTIAFVPMDALQWVWTSGSGARRVRGLF